MFSFIFKRHGNGNIKIFVTSEGYRTYLAGARTPEIDAAAEAHGEHVLSRPVHEVEIEVVLELGRIEHLEGDPRNLAGGLSRRPEQLLALHRDG